MPSYTSYIRQMEVLDADDVQWITVKGNHIPIKKGQSKEEAVKEFLAKKDSGNKKVDNSAKKGKVFAGVMNKVRNFKAKEEGTYDYATGKPKDYSNGYSVSFHQNEPDDKGNWKSDYGRYSESEYDDNAKQLVEETNGELNIGYFSGTPEVSVWVKDFRTAVKMAKKYNQNSIWNWKKGKVWINPDYDPKKNPMKQ